MEAEWHGRDGTERILNVAVYSEGATIGGSTNKIGLLLFFNVTLRLLGA